MNGTCGGSLPPTSTITIDPELICRSARIARSRALLNLHFEVTFVPVQLDGSAINRLLNVTAPLWLFIRAAYAVPFAVPSPGRSICNHL